MKKYVLEIGEKEYNAEVRSITTEEADIVVNGEQYKIKLKSFGRKKESLPSIEHVDRPVQAAPVTATRAPHKPAAANTGAGGELVRAPLPGLILDVTVKAGDIVKAGQSMVVMEAMKMENQVEAPHDGTVQKVYIQKGDSVAEDDALVELTRPLMTTI